MVLLVLLGGINFWGIQQSSKTNVMCTVVEASGLLLVIAAGLAFLAGAAAEPAAVKPEQTADWPAWTAIGGAVAIAFFAFIGFEDMVNVAEEVRSPKRNIPIAIISAVAIAGTVYIAVVAVATAVVPPSDLAAR